MIFTKEREKEQIAGQIAEAEAQLVQVQAQEELEPARDPYAEESRKALAALGITAVPFYKTVEFSEKLDDSACAALEAQLEKAGILDALVVDPKDMERVRKECPEFADAVINVTKPGISGFAGLTVSEELEGPLRTGVQCILSNLYVSRDTENGSHAGTNHIDGAAVRDALSELRGHMEQLEREYGSVPDFTEIDHALAKEKECELVLQMMEQEFTRATEQEQKAAQDKNQAYQVMLQSCKPFSYGRTEQEYDEVLTCIEEYRSLWQESREILFRLVSERSRRSALQERIEQEEQAMDEALVEKRRYSRSIKEYDIQIRQYEEYLNRPENIEKARRLQKHISSMFELVEKLDFDYIMNSQALWGCFETVKGLRIAELRRPMNSQVVTVIRFTWNGHERILDVQ